MKVILKGRAGNQQTISRIEKPNDLCEGRLLVFDAMSLEDVRWRQPKLW